MDLNSKEPLELPSIAYQCVPVMCGCSCERVPAWLAPTNTVSCCDKSVALFVPSHQKYTHSGPQPNSSGEWGKACKGGGPITSGQRWSSCPSPSDHVKLQRPPLKVGAVPPLSDWGLSEDKTLRPLSHWALPRRRNHLPSSLVSLRKAKKRSLSMTMDDFV